MKGLYTLSLALIWTASAFTSPVNLDFTERAQHDANIVARSLLTDGAAFQDTKFTHIVVGGGTAGVAVAVRLSEVSSNIVGLIEAGPDGSSDPRNYIPGYFGANLGSEYDWNYTTAASPSGAPSIGWPRGKVLGGSSVLNFLVWDRAAKVEYDAWEDLGNKGWNWENMYKYMKKAETFSAPSASCAKKLDITPNPSNYGNSGPIQISYPKYVSQQVSKWIPALQSLGITKNDEPLAGNNIGASVQPSDIRKSNSTRSSSNYAYFAPASGRSNLKVLVSALATKVNLQDGGKNGQTATGVTYTSGGKTYTAKASQKVIISGGTVNTPALLELSGIGSLSILKNAGVAQKIDNANVGENMQDHVFTSAAYELVAGITTLDSLRNNATFAAEQMNLYKQSKRSILDETVPSIGYLTLDQLVGSANSQQYVNQAKSYVDTQKSKPYYATLAKQVEFLEKYPNQVSQMEVIGVDGFFATNGAPSPGSTYVTFLAAQQHLLSRGTIHITSNDASAKPSIQPNYFTAPFDLDILTAGTTFLRKIAGTAAYSKSYISKEVVPGAGRDLMDYTLKTFTTEYHPVGTASMLPKSKGGVVDANLLVYGTSNLHVVDASVIPSHVSAHIQATIYGIAEAAADILKGKSL